MQLFYKTLFVIFLIVSVSISSYALSDAEIEVMLGRMTTDEKIGQLLLYGIGGREIGPVAEAHISKRRVGGIILYSRNIQEASQVVALTTSLQRLAAENPNSIPLFIAIDQEGGIVARLKKGATVLPGNMALGATRSQDLAAKTGELTAIELSAVGINFNCAPVMDVNTNPINPVIGVRSYSETPTLVSQLGTAYIQSLQKNGVLATAKHFPGHGDASLDSHFKLPVIEHSQERIDEIELLPFRDAIDSGVAAIMSAHVLYPKLDPEYPATLSPKILTRLLRQRLGFEGLIMTDDMEMKAIDDQYEIGNAAVLAIQAGADLILVSATFKMQQRVYGAIRQAVQQKVISPMRIDNSVRRILYYKSAYGLFDQQKALLNNPDSIGTEIAIVGNRQHRDVAQTIANRSITIVKNTQNILPMSAEPKEPVLLLSPSRNFTNAYLKAHTDLTHITPVLIPRDVNPQQVASQLLLSKPSKIVAGIVNSDQAKIVHLLSQKTDVPIIVISHASPYLLSICPDVECAIAAYDTNYYSLLAAVEVLLGKKQATGKLPVTLMDSRD